MKKYLVLLVSLLTFQSTFLQNTDVFHKVKINYSKASDLVKLANNGVCIDHGINKKNHFFISDFSTEDLNKINLLGFSYEILIEDVISFYQSRNKADFEIKSNDYCETTNDYVTPENYDFKEGDDFGGFYTYNEMLDELDDMYFQYPYLISERVDIKDPNYTNSPHIHETYEGRFIQLVKI